MKSCLYLTLSLALLLGLCGQVAHANESDEQLTVNASTTDVEGLSKQDVNEANKLADIFVLQKQLVYKLLQHIGITEDKLSPDVKKAINKPQTTNLKAFKAFSLCLDLMDKKQFTEAREQCDEAVKQDPNFALAQNFRQSIPDHDETMPQIVEDHLGNPRPGGEKNTETVLNTIPSDSAPPELPNTIAAETCQLGGGVCQNPIVDQSTPPCNDDGQCGFYSTFLVRTSGDDLNEVSNPYMNRIAVAIPPDNSSGNISINQIGHEGVGRLNFQIDPNNENSRITGFHDGQFNQGIANIAASDNNRLDRIVTQSFPINTRVTGLELGTYIDGFDANGRLGTVGGSQYDLVHGAMYFAEGSVTPTDRIKDLATTRYEGVVNGEFSSNRNQVIVCQGCGSFNSTLNYAAGRLENFNLTASVNQSEQELSSTVRINADNVALKSSGEFEFNQTTGKNISFQEGGNPNNLQSADSGYVAGRPFGSNAELLGGVFAVQGRNGQWLGNFGGVGRPVIESTVTGSVAK